MPDLDHDPQSVMNRSIRFAASRAADRAIRAAAARRPPATVEGDEPPSMNALIRAAAGRTVTNIEADQEEQES